MSRTSTQHFEITFPELPALSVALSVDAPVPVDAVEAHLTLREKELLSFFTTHNVDGEHLVPAFIRKQCPFCQAISRVLDKPENVGVRIIPDDQLSRDEVADLVGDLRDKIRPLVYGYSTGYGYGSTCTTYASGSSQAKPAALRPGATGSAPEPQVDSGSRDVYRIYRAGRMVAEVNAEMVELLAAGNADFASALGLFGASDGVD